MPYFLNTKSHIKATQPYVVQHFFLRTTKSMWVPIFKFQKYDKVSSISLEHFKQHKPLISEAWKLTIITSGFKWAENIISTVTTCIMKFQWFLLAIYLAFATICSIEISIWIFKWAKIDFCCFSSCNSWKNVSKIQNDQK